MTAADVAMANKHQDIASLIRESAATEPVTEDSDDLQVRRFTYTHFKNIMQYATDSDVVSWYGSDVFMEKGLLYTVSQFST